jgi:5'-3' exonuclease
MSYIIGMKFCIIDIHNMVHRAKHATGRNITASIPFNQFADEDEIMANTDARIGIIITAVFNYIKTSFDKFGADHCIAAFDLRSWRRDFYEDYKANRRIKIMTPADIADDQMITHIIDEIKTFF